MNLTDDFIQELVHKGYGTEDALSEDYAYILSELADNGILEARCDVWCDECEEESEDVIVDTFSFEWTCPICGRKNDQ